VHPAAGRQVAQRGADGDVVATNRRARGDVDERDLVALRHAVDEPETVDEHCAGSQAAIVGDDRDVVVRMHLDAQRRRHSLFWHGGSPRDAAPLNRDDLA
jgi:hypothetical protein